MCISAKPCGAIGAVVWHYQTAFHDAPFPLGAGRTAERSGDELTLKRTARAKEPSISITVPPHQFWQKLSGVAFAPSCRLWFI